MQVNSLASAFFSKSKFASRAMDINSINPLVVKSEYAVRGAIVERSGQLRAKMLGGEKFPFKDFISCNIGNPFSVGKRAITFPRQLLAAVECPSLIESKDLPEEARMRAKQFLTLEPSGLGAYTQSQGIEFVRKHIAEFISKRDGIPADSNQIYLSTGASQAVTTILTMLISHPKVGILTPYPTYPLYTAEIVLRNGQVVPYFLKESSQWSLELSELKESYEQAKSQGIDVRAIVVINPGNPTGSVMTVEQMKNVVKFCEENNVLLIADEVYQDNIYNPEKPFVSFKKVAHELNSDIQIISLHSISKGFMGECGHRGGYMELQNVPQAVVDQIYKMSSISLCPNSVGQLLVDAMVKPPESKECRELWEKEKNFELNSLKEKALRLQKTLNTLPGIHCQPADGSMYLFPSLELPLKALEASKSARFNGKPVQPDMFWSLKLLEETGIIVVPGSGFGQVPGTNHFRITFLPVAEKMDAVIERISKFQNDFMKQYA